MNYERRNLSQRQSLEEAADLVDELGMALGRAGLCSIRFNEIPPIPLAEVLRGPLTVELAAVLRGDTSGRAPLREIAYRAKEAWVRRRASPDGRARERTLLFLPSRESHIRMFLGVATALRQKQVVPGWVVVRGAHWRLLQAQRQPTWYATDDLVALRAWMSLAPELAKLHSVFESLSLSAYYDIDTCRKLLMRTASLFQRHVGAIARFAAQLDQLLEGGRTRLLVVGNPAVPEGRIAAHLAQEYGVPTAALQHGRFDATDPVLRGARVDLFCSWSKDTGQAAEDVGFAAQSCWTGAPWNLPNDRNANARGTTILVALSGAGHGVSAQEHAAVLEALRRCVVSLPESKWVFRVHPKDQPEYYHEIAQLGPARCSVQLARKAPPIEEALFAARVLFTVGSASAIDAMRQGVPVVTLARAQGEPEPDYVLVGATTHVRTADELPTALERLLASGPEPATEEACRAYIESLYGPEDGRALERIGSALVSRMTQG